MVPLTEFECAERSELPSPRKRGEGASTTGGDYRTAGSVFVSH